MNQTLNAISPVDGRYAAATRDLSAYFSELALFRYRIRIEAEYFIALAGTIPQLKPLTSAQKDQLSKLWQDFSESDSLRIKEIEKTTNHDVKAVEYFMKEKLQGTGLESALEFIHFGLTSQDINNTAIPLLLREASENIIIPDITNLAIKLHKLADDWKDIPMLARTHGQPASPTRLGKEIMVFRERIFAQLELLKHIPWSAKFGGATGNFNAHHAAYPEVDWIGFGNKFLQSIGLHRSQFTTQIEHYDNLAATCDNFKRICTILVDLCRDFWTYISMEYFRQKVKAGEVGSSAMPHKVNPIDFENAEGNLGIAISLLSHFAEKLPISRLQRDLTDSTVLRNIGVPFAHLQIALKSLHKGLDKVVLNQAALEKDLDANWAVLAEAIQTVLRREGYEKPYEALRDLTRGNETVTRNSLHAFIDTLKVSDAVKQELKKFTPSNYTGINPEI